MENLENRNISYDKLLQTILDIGEEMVVAGAEVSRVEESIQRMCRAYGCDRINVFIIVSNLQVTVEAPDGQILTHIRCIERNDVNFDRLDYLNDLSRYICVVKPDVEHMKKKLDEVMNRKEQPGWLGLFGCICAASGFTAFFGGSVKDSIAAVGMAVVIVLITRFLAPRENNQIVFNFITSFLAGIAAVLMVHAGVGTNADKIMMGGIMLLIPGIAMTNAIRDMLIGDIASGMLRLTNALIVAAAIACGFAMAIVLTGGVLHI
ncbi:threonine/serine exporter family protein [Hornefia butyriciproducens]|uniref:Threonine/serine exporter family protein n=1 Tax=Hornefia butyriciproducens TaxID=2652293 RepID=A0A6L5Y2W6_9FIRM|nr:threonine/serine exporter family protein [Hornefia butyriciproducens]MST50851.1 threonine/serine exporter family protein [Hornefia butyriciproducens]